MNTMKDDTKLYLLAYHLCYFHIYIFFKSIFSPIASISSDYKIYTKYTDYTYRTCNNKKAATHFYCFSMYVLFHINIFHIHTG